MKLAILFVALTAAAAAPFDPSSTGSDEAVRLFKSHGVFIYKYTTTLKVLNPTLLRDDPHTWIRIAGKVRLYFQDNSVEMTMFEPTMLHSSSLDPEFEMSAELIANLERPIYFSYVDGVVGPVRFDKDEPTWMLNLKKGILNLISIDYLGKDPETGLNDMFTKVEKTIHGVCEVTYTMDKYDSTRTVNLQYWNVTKSINTNNCTHAQMEEWNTVSSSPAWRYTSDLPAEETLNPVTRGITTQHFKLVSSESSFKITEVHATGIVSYHPFFDKPEDVIVAFAEQTLTLVEEDISSKPHRSDKDLAVTNLIMTIPSLHSMADEISRTLDDKKEVVDYIHSTIEMLSKKIDDSDSPMMDEDSTRVLSLVNTLRRCDYKTLQMLYERCVKSSEKIVVWFMRIMSMVKTEDSIRLVVTSIRDVRKDMSEIMVNSLNEYIFSLAFAGNVTLKMLDNMKEFCSLPSIRANTILSDSCLATGASMVRAYCNYVSTCNPSILELLEKPLQELLDGRRSSQLLDPDSINFYFILAETSEHPSLWSHLQKIIEAERLPLETRVRAVLACRPLVRKLGNQVRLPLLKVFRNVNYDEELRMAAFTCLLESPTPSILMTCSHQMRYEPSPSIRRFVFEALLSMQEANVYPKTIREVSKTCIDYIISRRSAVTGHRWFSHFLTKVFKPAPTESISARLHSKLFFTRNSSIPRYVHSKMNVALLGREINVLDFEMRLEGLQELLGKLMGQGPSSVEAKETQKNSRSQNIVDNLTKRKFDVPPKDESFKVMGTMKIFGNHLSTMSTRWANSDSIFSMFSEGGLQQMLDWEKKLRTGHDLLYKKTIMPLEVIFRVPSCAGIPVVFNVTSMMVAGMKTSSKLWTTPSLFRMETLLKGSVDRLNADIRHMHSAVLEVRGGIYFQTPVVECGHRMRKVVNMTMTSTIRADMNKEKDSYSFEVDTDSPASDVLKVNTRWEHFISLTQPFLKTNGLDCRKVDCTPTPPTVFTCPITLQLQDGAAIQREDLTRQTQFKATVALKIGEGRFVSAKQGKITFSNSPLTWVIENYGPSMRLFTFYMPNLGYLSMDPVSNNFDFHSIPKPVVMRWLTSSSFLIYTMPFVSRRESVYLKTVVPFVDYLASTDSAKTSKVDAEMDGKCTEIWRPANAWPTFSSGPTFEDMKTHLCTSSDIPAQYFSNPSEKCVNSSPSSIVIPVYPEQIYDLQVVGKRHREASLDGVVHVRIGNKYLSVTSGKLVVSATPFEWRVTFFGARRRIVSLYAESWGYLSVDPDTGFFQFTSEPKLFVMNILPSKAVTISTIVIRKITDMVMAEYDSRMDEETFISIFQNDAVFLPESKYYYEQKVKDPKAKFIVKHLNVRKNEWVLSVHKTALFMDTISSVEKTLEDIAVRNATCWGKEFGVSLCIAGYGPAWSSDSILRSALSPMMYRIFTTRNTTNGPTKIVASLVKDISSSSDSKSVWNSKVTLVGTFPERRVDIMTTCDMAERLIKVTATHSPREIELLRFPKFCWELKYAGDNITSRASFDTDCKTDHFKMFVRAEDFFRRLWMTFEWEASRKNVPSFWVDAITTIKSFVLVPILNSPWLIFVKPTLIHETPMVNMTTDFSRGHLTLRLLDMKTAKMEVKLGSEKFIYKNVQLPLPIWGLPIGTKHYPLSRKLATLTSPPCYYHNTSLYTFDQVHYRYDLNSMDCPHVLVQNCSASISRFAVTARWLSETSRSVMIIINKTLVEIEPSRDVSKIPMVKIDGEVINPLFKDDKYKHMKPLAPRMKIIWESDLQQLVFYNYELELEVILTNGRFIRTTVSSLLFSKTCGMCGNMDSDPSNDLTIPTGRKIKDWQLFGMNWILPNSDCSKGCPFTLDYITLTSPQSCTSLATVPQCRSGCLPKEKLEVSVPFRCSNMTKSIRVSVPNKCECSTCSN